MVAWTLQWHNLVARTFVVANFKVKDLHVKYRPEIDGLRAVAVVPVILFHAGFDLLSGGFIGVDVFFVISGYLIATIILREIQDGRFSLLHFYERRARRILPALFCVVICTLPFAWVWLDPFALKEFSQSLLGIATFSANIYFYLKTGYFDTAAELKPFLHTWSLAVEEQFYVFFPLILLVLKRASRRLISPVLAALFVVSFVLSQRALSTDPSASFYLLQTRAWEILMGAFVAVYATDGSPVVAGRWNNALAGLGLALIVGAMVLYTGNTPFPGVAALAPTLGTLLIILYATSGTIVYWILSNRIMVWIGLLSYSAYLWHQPLLAFYRQIYLTEPDVLAFAVIVGMTFGLALLTYHVVEKPFRGKGSQISTGVVFSFSLVGLVGLLGIGILGHMQNGFPARDPQMLRQQQNGGLSLACSGASLDASRCRTAADPHVILWGDSHAMHLGGALADIYSNRGLWQTTLSGCPPVPGYMQAPIKAAVSCADYNDQVRAAILALDDPAKYTVILSSSMDLSEPRLATTFQKLITDLKAKGVPVAVISTTPRFADVSTCIIAGLRAAMGFDACNYNRADILNADYFSNMTRLLDRLDVPFIDLTDLFCDAQTCTIEKDGLLLLRDWGHFAIEATPLLRNYLAQRLD